MLEDVLEPGLELVICGSAAGAVSAARGQYYAGPGNRFWPTLREVGLTPRLLAPGDSRELPAFGIDLTDIAKGQSEGGAGLPPPEPRRDGVAARDGGNDPPVRRALDERRRQRVLGRRRVARTCGTGARARALSCAGATPAAGRVAR